MYITAEEFTKHSNLIKRQDKGHPLELLVQAVGHIPLDWYLFKSMGQIFVAPVTMIFRHRNFQVHLIHPQFSAGDIRIQVECQRGAECKITSYTKEIQQ